jgi:hypothetical protein
MLWLGTMERSAVTRIELAEPAWSVRGRPVARATLLCAMEVLSMGARSLWSSHLGIHFGHVSRGGRNRLKSPRDGADDPLNLGPHREGPPSVCKTTQWLSSALGLEVAGDVADRG